MLITSLAVPIIIFLEYFLFDDRLFGKQSVECHTMAMWHWMISISGCAEKNLLVRYILIIIPYLNKWLQLVIPKVRYSEGSNTPKVRYYSEGPLLYSEGSMVENKIRFLNPKTLFNFRTNEPSEYRTLFHFRKERTVGIMNLRNNEPSE